MKTKSINKYKPHANTFMKIIYRVKQLRENKANVTGAGGPDNRHFSVSLVIQPVNGKGDPGEGSKI
ncbi:hypothetical protein [Pantoea allii]|uniref:hypothetical protein n=1 Tax=Pantoea allii TaxID=574096 RepID=UPI0024B8232E|nr:hypothetical protein [Pantoea allii]MDJ0038614.1 hypothetical protein [Pantoea allii]